MSGQIEKFQNVKVDGVITADLTSGKDEAKARRKLLNAASEKLKERIDGRAAELDKLIEAAKKEEEEKGGLGGGKGANTAV